VHGQLEEFPSAEYRRPSFPTRHSTAHPDRNSIAEPETGNDSVAEEKHQPQDPELRKATGKTYRLFEGTILECVLTNRLDGSFSGPVNVMLTTSVYSHDRQSLLIPQGTRILGEVQRVNSFGQQRLAVFFHRMIMPDGFSVSLDSFQGLNQIGETGLRDKVNRHYFQTFGVSLAVGAIAGLAQANTQYGLAVSGMDAYRQGVSTSLSQSSLRILDRYLNVLPTFTVREGHRIKVHFTNDVMLPAYNRHRIDTDL
jgi:type IV secretion system protein VirB10